MLLRLEFLQTDTFHAALAAGLALAAVSSLLSVLVVLKRMAFIGEGIAHAGFGGMGTALFLGLASGSSGGAWQADLVVLAFCLTAAAAMGFISRGQHVESDSAIGIVLVAAMAWGVLMTDLHVQFRQDDWYIRLFGPPRPSPNLETLLFGSLLNVGPYDVWLAVGGATLILLLLALFFKEILFYAFDETVSRVFGVPTTFIHYLLLALVAGAVVMTVRLAGIVLVSALLVIPGATANLLSRRLGRVFLIAWIVGTIGVAGGLLLSVIAGSISTGPCIVAVLCGQFALAYASQYRRRRISAA